MNLDLKRVGLLLKRRFLTQGRSTLLVFAPALLVFIFAVLSTFGEMNDSSSGEGASFFNIWFGIFLLGLGYWITSASLPDTGDPDGRQGYLTLPASNLEKWFATWLWSGPMFFLVFTLGYWLVTLITNGLCAMADVSQYTSFSITNEPPRVLITVFFCVVQPLAMLGAIVFNRFAFAKTAASLFVLSLASTLFFVAAVRIIYYDYFEGFFTPITNLDGGGPDVMLSAGLESIWTSLVFAVVILVATFFKYQEKEV